MADKIRIQIEESLKTCLKNLPACKTIKQLAVPAEIMIRQITALIRPGCDVEFMPVRKDPQEILSKEESKEDNDLDITFWMDKLTFVIKERAKKTLEQIQELLADRAVVEQVTDRLVKVNSKSVIIQKQMIETYTKEIEAMQNEEGGYIALKVNIAQGTIKKIKKAIDQIPKNQIKLKLETRYNDPYMDFYYEQDYECPSKDAQSFDNYLVAVQNCGTEQCNFNFTFKRGETSDLESNKPLRETKIKPEGAEVRRAVVWYDLDQRYLTCIELFDKNGRKLLKAGDTLQSRQQQNNKQHEILLEEGERIIGFKSQRFSDDDAAHCDFQFLLGKLI